VCKNFAIFALVAHPSSIHVRPQSIVHHNIPKDQRETPRPPKQSPNNSNSKIVDPFEIPSMLRNTKFSEEDLAISQPHKICSKIVSNYPNLKSLFAKISKTIS